MNIDLNSYSGAGGIIGLGIVVGGVLAKWISHISRRERMDHQESEAIRKELRSDISRLRMQLVDTMEQLNRWRDAYYTLAQKHTSLEARCTLLEKEVETLMRRSQPSPQES